jgi:cell wall-associated NlpC family hydrolase
MSPRPTSCSAELAAVRAEPRDDAEQVTQVLRGEPLTVEEARDGWARIRTAYDYPGWVREEHLEPSRLKPGSDPSASWLPAETGTSVLDEARRYLGAPYEWGGMTERGIDCSGLVHMAYRRTGRLVPRDAHEQEAAGDEVPASALRSGDLVCYDGHIAFWLGEGRILHSTSRDGVNGVLEEPEPAELRPRFRRYVRLEAAASKNSEGSDPGLEAGAERKAAPLPQKG